MKKIYLKSLALLAGFTFFCHLATAQFSFSPDASVPATIEYDNYTEIPIYIINQTTDSLSLSWDKLSNSLPSGWNYSLCDNVNCFTGIPNSNNMNKIAPPPAPSGFFKLILNPYNIAGTGIVELFVYEPGDSANGETVTFTINTLSDSVSIIGITSGTNGKFVVANDFVANFPASSGFTVKGSTGNNGTYTVISSSLVGSNTEITVANVPNATTDGKIIYATTSTGIDANNNVENNVAIFPNPAKNFINVKLDANSSIKTIEIYNIIGKKVMVLPLNNNELNKISLNELPTGVYFMKYGNGNGTFLTKKFYKTN